MERSFIAAAFCLIIIAGCTDPSADNTEHTNSPAIVGNPFSWDNANIYFMLTDRFCNGDTTNDVSYDRTKETATLRGLMGGDMKGIIQKIDEGYFDKLGVNAIWFTPVFEQNKGIVDEGTGATYGYHGYWIQDWTSFDQNFGSFEDFKTIVEKAHAKGIRVIMDVVINHTGPVTMEDAVWPDEWVRTGPKCEFKSYATTVNCTLVKNLPDIKTESNENVELPQSLKDKWEKEGKLQQELAELDAFFERTGYPRAPRFYIMKWLTDYIRKLGIDGYRIDTAKHTEETVWQELRNETEAAFAEWKNDNPSLVLSQDSFYMVGEVYNYNIENDLLFNIGDRNVNYYENAMNSLINFGFKVHGHKSYEECFSYYSSKLNSTMNGKSVVNYISSHDDSSPFDKEREMPLDAGTRLLLCPGAVQIYYGDETARPLIVEGANGDANMRSFMNWEDIAKNTEKEGVKTQDVLAHWQKLGTFRAAHLSVGAGQHTMISDSPYLFKRTYQDGEHGDTVVVGLDLPKGKKSIKVDSAFVEGTSVLDYYSGKTAEVKNGQVDIESAFGIVLLGIE